MHRYERQSGNQSLRFSVPHTCSCPKRSQIIFHCSFPIQLPRFETRDDKRNFACFPTCPFVCVISTLKSWSVSSCCVSFCPATTYSVSAVPLVSSRRCAIASACHACQTTTRSLLSRCQHSPDDMMWWHTVTRHVPVANYISSIQKSIGAIRF